MGGRQPGKGMSRIPCPEISDMYPKTASLAQFRNTTEFLITDKVPKVNQKLLVVNGVFHFDPDNI